MPDLSELMEHLKSILPTPATWFVTSSTLGITIAIAALPGYLKEVWPELHIPEILLFQAALISTTLFFGSFVLVVLLLRYINKLNELHSAELAEISNSVTPSNPQENEKNTLTFTNANSVKIAPGIEVKAAINKKGWYCVSDDLICTEHQRTLKPDNYSRPYEYTCRAAGCKIKLQTPFVNLAISEAKDLAESHIRNTLNVEPRKTNRIYG